ncbi:MAG: TonB-dependent receptor [Flavobacteriales bacterium]|nr:TonB-dependent receptor [Flavobacteriales bacterium]
MFKHLFILLITTIFCKEIIAQTHNFSGKIADQSGLTMPGATVMLLNKTDSTFYKFSTTNADGDFSIKQAKNGEYLLQISFVGYQTHYQTVSVTDQTPAETSFGTITLNLKAELIKTVEIQDEHVPMLIKKDTIEYNADAFKTQPDANVGDLLKKLPGVEIDKTGTVKAQGENVKKILIDGKEFFGDDTKLATENLPADMVKKVQVYDDYSEISKITGIDDGDRSKTINLKLKKDRKKGLFGTVEAGGGTNDDKNAMYDNRFNINKFTDKMQLSTLGMINNVNKQGFSYRDYLNFVGGAQNAGGGFSDPNANSYGVPIGSRNSNDGLTKTIAGGANLNIELTPGASFSGNYFYNRLDKDIKSISNRQYITDSDTTNFKALENNSENQLNQNHRVNLKYTHKLDSTQDLTIKTSLLVSNLNNTNYTSTDNISLDGYYLNRSNSNNQTLGNDLSGNGSILYGKRFSRVGRSLVANATVGSFENLRENEILNYNDYFIKDTTLKQQQNSLNAQFNYEAKLNYTEPYAKGKYLELSYQRKNFQTNYKKDFFDINILNQQESLNSRLSQNYDNTFIYDQYGIGTKIIKGNSNVTVGVGFQNSKLSGDIKTISTKVNRENWDVLPNLKWTYQMATTGRIMFDYKTYIQQPSIDQLQPTINNSNPLNLYKGNPDLKSEYNHNGVIRFMRFNQFSFTNIFATLSANYTLNKITNSQVIDNYYITTTTPINVDKDYSISGYFYYSTPIRPIGSKINIGLSSSYNRSIVYVNTIKNNVDRFSRTIDLSLENRNKELFDLKGGSRISINSTEYSSNNSLNQNYISNQMYGDFMVDFFKKYSFNTSIEYTMYSGDQFTDNPKVPIWRAHFSRKFLKGDAGLIKFAVYDIFNQNIGINRTSQNNYIEDQRIISLGRYYMISISYKITRFGGKKKSEETTK